MKNVYFLIGTLSNGGAERVVSNLTTHFSDSISSKILLFGDQSKIDYSFKGDLINLDKKSHNSYREKLQALFSRIKKLKEIKKEDKKGVYISFLEYPNLLNLLSGFHISSLVSVRNYMSVKHKRGLKGKFWNLTIKLLYNRARKIVVVSEAMKNDLITNYKIKENKIKVIYNSYPLDKIKRLSMESLSIEESSIFRKPTIVTAGRLDSQKGHDHLIYSFSIVKKSIPEARLVILGEGKLKQRLKKLADDLEVGDDVFFLGFQENPYKYFFNAKVFALTSYYEGFPNALAGAMACGVPVLSTDCLSGPREIIAPNSPNERSLNYDKLKSEYGILVPDFSVRQDNKKFIENKIAENLIKVIRNENLYKYYAGKSIERSQSFSIENNIKEWEKLIEEINGI